MTRNLSIDYAPSTQLVSANIVDDNYATTRKMQTFRVNLTIEIVRQVLAVFGDFAIFGKLISIHLGIVKRRIHFPELDLSYIAR